MIYVPETSYSCYVVQSEDIIRAYKTMPHNNSTVDYRDFYINSDYIYRDGSQSFSTYATLPVCLDSAKITDSIYYRTDFDSILVIFSIMCIFCFLIPLKIFVRLFRRLQ